MTQTDPKQSPCRKSRGFLHALAAAAVMVFGSGCLVGFDVVVSDADLDGSEDYRRDDVTPPDVEWEFDPAETDGDESEDESEPPETCGNGALDPGEECDGAPDEACATSCGSTGTRRCRTDCLWTACAPPEEVCDGADQDCDGIADEDLWVLRAAPLLVNSGGGPAGSPSPAWGASAFSVLWEDNRSGIPQLFTSALAPDLSVVVPETQITSSGQGARGPSIAWDGTGIGAGWIDRYGTDMSREVYGGLFEASGTARSSLLNLSAPSPGDDRETRIAWTGSAFGAAWIASGGVHLAIVAPDFTSSSATMLSPASTASNLCLAWSGSRFGIFWEDRGSGGANIHGILAESDGTAAGAELVLNDDPSDQSDPGCAFGGGAFTVLWSDGRSGLADEIYGSTIQPDGTVTASEFPAAACTGDCLEPALLWTGDSLAAIHVDDGSGVRTLVIVRSDLSGSRLNPDLTVTLAGQDLYDPALAWSGSTLAASFTAGGAAENVYLQTVGCP